MTTNRRDQIKWRLEIDEESKQECFRNTATGHEYNFPFVEHILTLNSGDT